jgi:threonine/homoserine/homoserine lactone efflux protein
LVLHRGLNARFKSGVFIALGASLAEGIYAFLAFWGFDVLLADHSWIEPVSRGFAAAIMVVLAVVFLRPARTSEAPGAAPPPRPNVLGSAALGFTITGMNPTLIATWVSAVIILRSSVSGSFDSFAALAFGIGATAGIVSWFGTMLGLLYRFRARFQRRSIEAVRRGTGILLLCLAIWFAWRFVACFV